MSSTSSSYAPLNEVRRTLRVKWYRSPIDPAVLRRLMQRSDLRGAFQAVGHLALAAATGALTYYLFTQRLWAAFALALLFHGGVTSFFFAACHELDHGTVFKTKWLNRLFLRIYAFLAWFNYHDYALSHTYHHRYTLHPDGDREVVLPKTPSLRALYLLQLCSFSVTGGFESNGLIPLVHGVSAPRSGSSQGRRAAAPGPVGGSARRGCGRCTKRTPRSAPSRCAGRG